ncbi:hypothetical protein XENOCAPTIV_024317, partial [Xenoophorus captivus]
NRIGASGSQNRPKASSPPKVTDVRQLLEEKRQGGSQHTQRSPVAGSALWSRLGSGGGDDGSVGRHDRRKSGRSDRPDGSRSRRVDEGEEVEEREEEDDSTLQRVWGAMIKQKQECRSHKMKKSRLDNLPSLQIEISRDSSDDSDA